MMIGLRTLPRPLAGILSFCLLSSVIPALHAQDQVHTGIGLPTNQHIRLAAADFKPVGNDPQTPQLKTVFDATLFNDLTNAGVFDMVSKSMIPTGTPGSPQEINLAQWAADPANASMVALGALAANGGRLSVSGWVLDAKNPGSPQVLGKKYEDNASQDNARAIAHRFADDIIARLSGLNGIAETKIYFVSARTGTKEIWMMDYDGQNPKIVTRLGSTSLSPRISPDNTRLAFSSIGKEGWTIRMYSLELGRMVAFPAGIAGGSNFSPAWSGDGARIAFSSSRTGDPAIWVADSTGGNLHKITSFHGGHDVSPTWNPKTNTQIAWVSGRTGLPQIYTMDADGANIQRVTDGGYAISPSWSPNGQFLAFSWNRKYGPGAPGGQDIYVIDLASRRWLQLTHDAGSNDFPSWSPDGRHLVFQREIGHQSELWTMLADGTEQHQLTHSGKDSMPNWSWK
ncbi:MAG TPA: Tol-Pal system beta propeller repeat protein TolB [Acidobacteriaceae bacterium]|jgi:TolB protein|nr:Tol-Pal system beta propeller repeat protein TolB [Acidobacteriaceae bacterium]